MDDLARLALLVLEAPDPCTKVRITEKAADAWRKGLVSEPKAAVDVPMRPARPVRPQLRAPREMPKRSSNGMRGRIALLHALAHIELNAVDLAWDLIARFVYVGWPRSFYEDWVQVAADEARHFAMLRKRLNELGADYGDLPAHDGLWQAAEATARAPAARLAVIPMVMEARGLDVTPATVARLEGAGDDESAFILRTILHEEIAHVRAGRRWFEWLCVQAGIDARHAWPDLVRRYFRGELKGPFNLTARSSAGLGSDYMP
jgi:uncharacterized ferritin-like protein (DUF455 family)